MKKILLLSLLFAIFSNKSIAQNVICGTTTSNTEPYIQEKSLSCNNASSIYHSKYKLQSYNLYASNTSQAIKIIKVNLIIWQKNDGTGNFQDNINDRTNLSTLIDYVNRQYNNNTTPSDGSDLTCGVTVRNPKLNFTLNQIKFIKNTALYTHPCSSGNSSTYIDYINNYLPELKNQLNIHVVNEMISNCHSGYADGIPGKTVVTFFRPLFYQAEHMWGFSIHLGHEIGHVLGLGHTYNVGNTESPYLGVVGNSAYNPDYLTDVFCVYPYPHCGKFNISECTEMPHTNNFMGGGQDAAFLSPLQIGRIHRTLHLNQQTRKLACGFNSNDYLISNNEEWDFDMKIYNNLRIKAGQTLTIKCKVYMVPEAKIIIENTGKLIIDGGIIDVANECGNKWEGIYLNNVRTPTNVLNGTIRHNPPNVELLNGGLAKNIRTTNVPTDTHMPTPYPHQPRRGE